MRAGKRTVAAAAALSIGAGIVVSAQAQAAVDTSKQFQVGVTTGAPEGFQNVDVNKGRVSWLMYNSLSYGIMPTALYVDAFADGSKVEFAGEDTKVETGSNQGNDLVILTHTDPQRGVELKRTFTISPKEVDVRVDLRDLTGRNRDLRIALTDGLMSYDYTITTTPHQTEKDAYVMDVGGRYQLESKFVAPSFTGTGESQGAAASGTSTGARYQAGVWEKRGTSLSARMSVSGDASEAAKDTDGDGIPDEWEINGYTAPDGTEFPLHRWGADPQRKDLFLQLNWMKSEWETLGCSEKREYAVSEEEFAQFLDCANANVNVYRPSRAILNDLVDLFDRRGYNLHIDAGDYYTNIPGLSPLQGGPTIDYAPIYFNGEVPSARLVKDRKNLLGSRQAIFRVGIIGDQQERGNLSSGNGLISDGAFYVAKNYLMTSQEQMRNTILHEFGHNLGLTHSGAVSVKKPDNAYVPKYRSVMNYLYQFSHFDYSDTTSTPWDNVAEPLKCRTGAERCYTGTYNILPDWEHLDLVNGEIAKATGTTGVSDSADTAGNTHPQVDELVVLAAEANNGKAGLRVDTDKQNVIIANRSDSTVNVELSNLGIDLHTFTLQVDYPGGRFRKQYPVEGALSEYSKLPVQVPIANTAGYKDATMPVKFRVYNEDNQLVSEETIDFSVLNYTTEQMDQLVKELEQSNSPLQEQARNTVGKYDPAKPTLAKPAPVPTTANNQVQTGTRGPALTELNGATTATTGTRSTPKPEPRPNTPATSRQSAPANQTGTGTATGTGGKEGPSAGVIVGVIIAILAVVGLGGAAAAMAGLI